MQYFLIFLAFLCGAVFPTQAGLNTKMAKFVGHPVLSAFFSFLTGLIGLMIYAVIARIPLNLMSQCRNAPWYVWFAGLLGAFYVSMVIVLMPRLGIALTFGLIETAIWPATINPKVRAMPNRGINTMTILT